VACLKGAGNLSMLKDFTDKVKWDNTEKLGGCALIWLKTTKTRASCSHWEGEDFAYLEQT